MIYQRGSRIYGMDDIYRASRSTIEYSNINSFVQTSSAFVISMYNTIKTIYSTSNFIQSTGIIYYLELVNSYSTELITNASILLYYNLEKVYRRGFVLSFLKLKFTYVYFLELYSRFITSAHVVQSYPVLAGTIYSDNQNRATMAIVNAFSFDFLNLSMKVNHSKSVLLLSEYVVLHIDYLYSWSKTISSMELIECINTKNVSSNYSELAMISNTIVANSYSYNINDLIIISNNDSVFLNCYNRTSNTAFENTSYILKSVYSYLNLLFLNCAVSNIEPIRLYLNNFTNVIDVLSLNTLMKHAYIGISLPAILNGVKLFTRTEYVYTTRRTAALWNDAAFFKRTIGGYKTDAVSQEIDSGEILTNWFQCAAKTTNASGAVCTPSGRVATLFVGKVPEETKVRIVEAVNSLLMEISGSQGLACAELEIQIAEEKYVLSEIAIDVVGDWLRSLKALHESERTLKASHESERTLKAFHIKISPKSVGDKS